MIFYDVEGRDRRTRVTTIAISGSEWRERERERETSGGYSNPASTRASRMTEASLANPSSADAASIRLKLVRT